MHFCTPRESQSSRKGRSELMGLRRHFSDLVQESLVAKKTDMLALNQLDSLPPSSRRCCQFSWADHNHQRAILCVIILSIYYDSDYGRAAYRHKSLDCHHLEESTPQPSQEERPFETIHQQLSLKRLKESSPCPFCCHITGHRYSLLSNTSLDQDSC